jgi:transcription elongation factor Elf1
VSLFFFFFFVFFFFFFFFYIPCCRVICGVAGANLTRGLSVTSAAAQLRNELRNLIDDDDDDDEDEPPAPASSNPTFSNSRDVSASSTPRQRDDDADVAAIVARAVAQTQSRTPSRAAVPQHGFAVTDANVSSKKNSRDAVAHGAVGGEGAWVRTPDGELVQTRGGRSVSIASQAELSDIMASLAQARTVDEQMGGAGSALAAATTRGDLTRHVSVSTALAPPSSRKSFASRAFEKSEKSEPILRAASSTGTVGRQAAAAAAARPTEQTAPVINVDFATLTGTDWNDVLASLDEHRDIGPSSASAALSPRHADRRTSAPAAPEIVYSKLPDMSVTRALSAHATAPSQAAKSPAPSPSPSPRVAASETRSPRSAAAAAAATATVTAADAKATLSASAPAVTSVSSATAHDVKQCTRCGTGKVAARVKLENGRTLALCRSCTLKFKETAMQPQATPVRVQPYDAGIQSAGRVAGGAREADGDAARRQRGQRRRRAAQAQDSEPGRAALVAARADARRARGDARSDAARQHHRDGARQRRLHVRRSAARVRRRVRRVAGGAVWPVPPPQEQQSVRGVAHDRAVRGDWRARRLRHRLARAAAALLPRQVLEGAQVSDRQPRRAPDGGAGGRGGVVGRVALLGGVGGAARALRVRLDSGRTTRAATRLAMFTEQRLAQWLPTPLLRAMRASTLAAQLLAAYARVDAEHLPKTATGESEELLLQRFVRIYLKQVRKLPTFGLTPFEATRTDEEKPVPCCSASPRTAC